MKIAIITPGALPLPPVKGGAVETLIDLFLRSNEASGEHQIVVYTVFSKEAETEAREFRNCRYIYIRMDGQLNKIRKGLRFLVNRIPRVYIGNLFIHKVRKYFKTPLDYDIILVENKAEYGLMLRKISDLGGKLVLHLHNDFLNSGTDLARQIAGCYSKILTISDFIGGRVRAVSRTGNKIETVYNGIELSRFQPVPEQRKAALRARFGIGADDVVVLFTGRIVSVKGIRELVDAFQRVPLDLPAMLVVVGGKTYSSSAEDSYVRSLRRMARGAGRRIVLTGYVGYRDIPGLYAMADIGVVPSIWEEPLGLTVIEHLASGLPVVVSDSGGIPEVVDDRCAITVKRGPDFIADLSKALIRLIGDSELRARMGFHARERALQFDSGIYCKKLDRALTHD